MTHPDQPPPPWKHDGVRVVPGGSLDTNTAQTPGMDRKAAINFARVGAQKLWAGTVTIHPDAKTGAHHHGHLESVIYVVKGKARMRWGERLEFTAEAGPGDFIYIPPYVPHQEINASADQTLECVLVRSDGEAIAVNLDIEPVEKPENVRWIDPNSSGLRIYEMARHVFEPTTFHNAIGTADPVLSVADGDTIVTRTIDAWGFDRFGTQRHKPPNPMTGPFFIDGAAPGDSLEMRIERMTADRDGWTFGPLAVNVVEPGAIARMPVRERVFWRLDRAAGLARLAAPPPALRDWAAPFAPMIGCFGVAPALGQAFSTATSGPNGGNMDYRLLGPETTVWFPVSVPGALLYLGDGHFCQGDGEIVGNGVETSFEVEFTVRVRKGRAIAWPRGETAEDIFTIGNARPLDQALQHATTEMLAWLGTDYGLDVLAASHLMGQTVRYDVANVFNPAYSVACRMAKRWLAGRG